MPVSLKCDVDANPRAAPIWQKDDTDPPVQQTPDGFLNFTEIKREHSGWYKCISRHLLGRFSSIGYFLNVRCKLKFYCFKNLISIRSKSFSITRAIYMISYNSGFFFFVFGFNLS